MLSKSQENSSTLYIHAANVHHGGGKSLLAALLEACPTDRPVIATLDSRMILPSNLPANVVVRRVPPSIVERIKIEFWLRSKVKSQDTVFCFGNLPPLCRLSGKVIVMIQNRFLIDYVKLDHFSLKTKLRLNLERLWLRTRAVNANEFVVQLPSMKRTLIATGFVGPQTIHTIPYVDAADTFLSKINQDILAVQKKPFDFIYVASGDPHKNHRKLIEAWCILAQQGVYPSLSLTLSEENSRDLCQWIKQRVIQYRLKIENVGFLPYNEVLAMYPKSRALIYPSLLESFGLPLIEARQAGLAIVASELDYVRDLIEPEETFDPNSAVSIARAVKRFIGEEDHPVHVVGPKKFAELLFVNNSK